MARGVRHGCPSCGSLLQLLFDPIFRWLQVTVIPRNPDNLELWQPAHCGYADDLAVFFIYIQRVEVCIGVQYCNEEHPFFKDMDLGESGGLQ